MKRVIKTGTQVYGPVSEDSDWDFVTHRECAKALKELLEMLNVEVHSSHHIHPSYEGFYFALEGYKKIQIIVAFDEIEFETWRDTTDWMKDRDPIEDRDERIGTFIGAFRAIFEDKVEEGVKNEQNWDKQR